MSIHVQSLNNPWLKTYPREEKWGTRKEEERGAPGEGGATLFLRKEKGQKERAREGEG